LKPIPTEYKGTQYKSKLEANWAKWLVQHGIAYDYEVQGFNIEGTWYLPDFYLPELEIVIEVKGILERIDKAFLLYKYIQENCEHQFNKNIEEKNKWWEIGNGISCSLFLLASSPPPALFDINAGSYDGYYLGKCKRCGKHYVSTILGSWACSFCGNNDKNQFIGNWSHNNNNYGMTFPFYEAPVEWTNLLSDYNGKKRIN